MGDVYAVIHDGRSILLNFDQMQVNYLFQLIIDADSNWMFQGKNYHLLKRWMATVDTIVVEVSSICRL